MPLSRAEVSLLYIYIYCNIFKHKGMLEGKKMTFTGALNMVSLKYQGWLGIYGHFYKGLHHSLPLEQGMINSGKASEWDMDKSNNQEAIFKANAQRNIFDLLQEQICQSVKQLELDSYTWHIHLTAKSIVAAFFPWRRQDSLIQNRNC